MVELVRLDENFEISSLALLYEKIGAKIGDLLSMSVEDGRIVVRPLTDASARQGTEDTVKAAVSNAYWFGSVQEVRASVEEVDAYIRAERADSD